MSPERVEKHRRAGGASTKTSSGTSRRFYFALLLAALVPLVLFATSIAIIIGLRERDALEASTSSKVLEIAQGIDRYVAAQLKAAEIMAQVESLRESNLERFYDFAVRVKANEPGWNNVVVLDRSGQQLINLASPFGTPLPGVSDTASYQEILQRHSSVIGDLVQPGPVSGKMFVPLRVPVIESGEVKYIVTVDLDPVELSKLFSLAEAPPDWVGAIVDRNGRLLARSTRAEDYVGMFATPVALEAIKQKRQGMYEGRTLEGLDMVFAFYTSPLTGWSVHFAVPRATYSGPMQQMLLIITLGGLLALAFAVGLFSLIAREASRQRATEKERAATLERSEARLRSVFDTSYQYQGLMTPEGILVDANPTSLAGIEARLEDVVGKPFWETPWFTDTPGMPELVRAAIPLVTAGQAVRQEIEINLPTGRRAFDFAMRPVFGPAGDVIAIVPEAMEITERREAEAKLRQSQKMEAIGQLTGGIAHDFNNMLAVIIGAISLAKRHMARGASDISRFLDGALDGAQRAATLTQRLLAFSRQQPLAPQPIQINELVSGMTELLRGTIGETVQLQTVLAEGLWMTHADSGELENALLNLAINSRDAMPLGGQLTIETSNAFLDDDHDGARNAGIAPGQYVLISVTDTGTGMLPEVLQKAFDPFFTTKPTGQGTGLGLSQVFGFVRQSGGHVKIYSENGAGTSVKIYLPRFHGTDEVIKADPPVQTIAPQGRSEEVIIVTEDDEHLRHLTVGALEELGYTVLEADCAAAALRLLDANPQVCMLFTDVVMPVMNGQQLAEEALVRRPDLKVLYTTGYTRNAVVHNGILDPGAHLLVKPYVIDDLARKIREIMDALPAPSALR